MSGTDDGTGSTSVETRPQRFWAEWRDAVEPRTVALIVGVLLLQFGFILSYVGAFHAPKPHRIPVAVVAPAPYAAKVTGELNALAASPLKASVAGSLAVAEKEIRSDQLSAAFVVDCQFEHRPAPGDVGRRRLGCERRYRGDQPG